MSFPTINYKFGNNNEVADNLRTLTDHKFSALDKFIGTVPASCDVEFEKIPSHQSGNVFRAEANLTINGKLFRAESTRDSFEKAIDGVKDELDKEIRRSFDKKDTLFKKGGRKLKKMLHFGK